MPTAGGPVEQRCALDGLAEADDVATVKTMTTVADNLERAIQTGQEQTR